METEHRETIRITDGTDYVVWVGGVSLCEGITLQRALTLATEYAQQGYDDVIIERGN
jgi:hypothetical protein